MGHIIGIDRLQKMSKTVSVCPSCGRNKIEKIGKTPETIVFAGVIRDASIIKTTLYKCSSCHLHFKYPQLEKEELDILYMKAPETMWQSQADKRTDWKIASSWIKDEFETGAILDVGCFDGEFLKQLGANYECSGIEINDKAAQIAKMRGAIIAGADISDILKSKKKYDVITAFDVIEHVNDPRAFLKTLLSAVKPGRSVIISTGNTAALSWRLMGSSYWYSAYAEHISFINPYWCHHLAQSLGLKILRQEFYAHSDTDAANRLKDLAINLLYRISPDAIAILRRHGAGKTGAKNYNLMNRYPPAWASATDHFITLFRKPL